MLLVEELGHSVYSDHRTLIDVRSPGEYVRGHIPGSTNIPLFTDEERARVGTAYVRQGREIATEIGMEAVAVKLNEYLQMLEGYRQSYACKTQELLVYCWRGGMRSRSLNWFFNVAGFRSNVIEGGYKAYRRYALHELEQPWKFIVIGGYTGSGKTHVLHELRRRGEQVLDLEDLCNHRGSAFGALTMPPQPRSEHAMNLVHQALSALDMSRTIYVEDESQHIGSVWLHEPLFKHIRQSPLLFIRIPRHQRAAFLATEYGNASTEELSMSFEKIHKPLGGERLRNALQALSASNLAQAADFALDHYDKAYEFGMGKRSTQPIAVIDGDAVDIHNLATQLQHYGRTAYKS